MESAVFSIAKSLWNTEDEKVTNMTILDLNPLITLQDHRRIFLDLTLLARIINRIILSPPHPLTGKSSLAALTDNLGRILVLDLDSGEIIRLYKGMRDAQAGWILKKVEISSNLGLESGPRLRYVLFLVAYCPRGTLEVFTMKYQKRLVGIEVDRNLTLVSSAHALFGGHQLRVNQVNPNPTVSDSNCFLISPTGQIQKVVLEDDLVVQ